MAGVDVDPLVNSITFLPVSIAHLRMNHVLEEGGGENGNLIRPSIGSHLALPRYCSIETRSICRGYSRQSIGFSFQKYTPHTRNPSIPQKLRGAGDRLVSAAHRRHLALVASFEAVGDPVVRITGAARWAAAWFRRPRHKRQRSSQARPATSHMGQSPTTTSTRNNPQQQHRR